MGRGVAMGVVLVTAGCFYTQSRVAPDDPAQRSRRRRVAALAAGPEVAVGAGVLGLGVYILEHPPEGEEMVSPMLVGLGAGLILAGVSDLTMALLDRVTGDAVTLDADFGMHVDQHDATLAYALGGFHWPSPHLRLRYAFAIEGGFSFEDDVDGETQWLYGLAPTVSIDWSPGSARRGRYPASALTAYASPRVVLRDGGGATSGYRAGAGGCLHGGEFRMGVCLLAGIDHLFDRGPAFEGSVVYQFHSY